MCFRGPDFLHIYIATTLLCCCLSFGALWILTDAACLDDRRSTQGTLALFGAAFGLYFPTVVVLGPFLATLACWLAYREWQAGAARVGSPTASEGAAVFTVTLIALWSVLIYPVCLLLFHRSVLYVEIAEGAQAAVAALLPAAAGGAALTLALRRNRFIPRLCRYIALPFAMGWLLVVNLGIIAWVPRLAIVAFGGKPPIGGVGSRAIGAISLENSYVAVVLGFAMAAPVLVLAAKRLPLWLRSAVALSFLYVLAASTLFSSGIIDPNPALGLAVGGDRMFIYVALVAAFGMAMVLQWEGLRPSLRWAIGAITGGAGLLAMLLDDRVAPMANPELDRAVLAAIGEGEARLPLLCARDAAAGKCLLARAFNINQIAESRAVSNTDVLDCGMLLFAGPEPGQVQKAMQGQPWAKGFVVVNPWPEEPGEGFTLVARQAYGPDTVDVVMRTGSVGNAVRNADCRSPLSPEHIHSLTMNRLRDIRGAFAAGDPKPAP
jgi:hypothetical protein